MWHRMGKNPSGPYFSCCGGNKCLVTQSAPWACSHSECPAGRGRSFTETQWHLGGLPSKGWKSPAAQAAFGGCSPASSAKPGAEPAQKLPKNCQSCPKTAQSFPSGQAWTAQGVHGISKDLPSLTWLHFAFPELHLTFIGVSKFGVSAFKFGDISCISQKGNYGKKNYFREIGLVLTQAAEAACNCFLLLFL